VTSADARAQRLLPIRRRVVVAQAGLALGGAVVFGAAMLLARAHSPGHTKQRLHLRPLAASSRYLATVRADLGDAGIIRHPLASPAAATAQS
jgi:hypothetical protein